MAASTEASSDSNTDSCTGDGGEAAVDHLLHDDAADDIAPGQDAGVGPGSLAFTSSSSQPAPSPSSGSSPRSARADRDSSTSSSPGAGTCSGFFWDRC